MNLRNITEIHSKFVENVFEKNGLYVLETTIIGIRLFNYFLTIHYMK